mgnify:CR=1 FL=1
MLDRLRETYRVQSWESVEKKLPPEVSSALHQERLALGAAVRNLHHIFHPEAILLITRFQILLEVFGDAVRAGLAAMPPSEYVLVVYGDCPLLRANDLRALGAAPGLARPV